MIVKIIIKTTHKLITRKDQAQDQDQDQGKNR